jgi:amino acid adenylation domain-containing protein
MSADYLLDQALARAAQRYAGREALVGPRGERWSYARLAGAAADWAGRLAALGAGRGARLGVWMAKSPEAVAALWGALQQGVIYVPFDPGAPSARVAQLADDCAVTAMAVDAERAELARAWERPPRLLLPQAEAIPAPAGREESGRTGDDVAYILYTSGSTGVPKGVMLTHAHALNFIRWAGAEIGVRPGDRVANHAPFHFDLSVFDLWATLTRGATVCLLDRVTARFPRAVADWIVEQQVTVWYSVPSALVALLPQAASVARAGVRAVAFAGEVFPPPALEAWRQALPDAAFHNWYGPTETNVCTHFRLGRRRGGAAAPAPLPLGSACPNFELRIGDAEATPVAAGESGFLWARGPGLLAGYWGDAERTRQVCRWRAAAGGTLARWYNTGDVVRQGERGEVYFEGRRDDVIKLRGYRVALREIERALEGCAGVRQAAVVVAGAAEAPTLVGYVAAEAAAEGAGGLREQLSRLLPTYMLPERIEVRAELPLTSSGKIDRQALRAPAARAQA